MERKIEIQSCDLKTFLDDQNSDHFWIKGGGWKVLNVETILPNGDGYGMKRVVWLTRTVEVTLPTVKVV